MDQLREHILKIPQEEIPDGHMERFNQRLNAAMPATNLFKKRFIYSVYLAAAMLIIAISLVFLSKNPERLQQAGLILNRENTEIIETEQYLQGEIDRKVLAIHSLLEGSEHAAMIEDIKEIDLNLVKLKEDYKEAPGDQRIVEAVLSTYILKMETLDIMMNFIQNNS